MKKILAATAIAAGLAAVGAAVKLALPGKSHTGSNAYLSSPSPEPVDELLVAANQIVNGSDYVVEPESAFVTRTQSGGLALYGQVSSSAAAGALARRIRALDPTIEVVSNFKVAKRA